MTKTRAPSVPAPRGAGPFVVLLTMTSRAEKLWPEAQWRELIAWLGGRGLGCLLPWGSIAERERCERIASGFEHARVPGHMALAQFAAMLVQARAVAGLDTGLTHLAAGLGVPVAGIFCGSDPALTGLHGAQRIRILGARGMPPRAGEVRAVLEEWL